MKVNELINEDKNWGDGIDGRIDFNESWLFIEPGQMEFAAWPAVKNDINDLKKARPNAVQKINNNLYKMDFENDVYYWYEKDGILWIGSILEKKPRNVAVLMTGKNPDASGSPYASDLYLAIINDLKNLSGSPKNLVVSDKTLSASGFKIWHRLFSDGHVVSVYDRTKPGESFTRCETENELKSFFGKDRNYQNYRYILSETPDDQINIWPSFKIRKAREENNLPLD
jgi:hypothetical protein